MAVVETDAMTETSAGREDRARREADAMLERLTMQVQRVDPLIELDPHEVSAGRTRRARTGREVARDGFDEDFLLFLQRAAQLAKMTLVGTVFQLVGERGLRRRRGS